MKIILWVFTVKNDIVLYQLIKIIKRVKRESVYVVVKISICALPEQIPLMNTFYSLFTITVQTSSMRGGRKKAFGSVLLLQSSWLRFKYFSWPV